MTNVTRIGPCANCGRSMKIRARGLCRTCYGHRTKSEYRLKIEMAIAEKMPDEWWHFKGILGREIAIRSLAKAFKCSPVNIETWVEENDPVWAVAA